MKFFFKKSVIFFIISLCLVSCSKIDEKINSEKKITLRYEINKIIESSNWTYELEPERLTKNLSEYKNISKNVRITPLSILCNISDFETSQIFPHIEGFGSLDISNTPKEISSIIEKFCSAIEKEKEVDSFMAKNSIYSLALFYQDLNGKNLKSHIVGSSFVNGTTYEIPIRFFYGKKNSLDINLFFTKEENFWKIDQIYILRDNKF